MSEIPYIFPLKARCKLTSKGQITLPVKLRRHWDLKAGDRLDFTLEANGRVIVRKWVRGSVTDVGEVSPPLTET